MQTKNFFEPWDAEPRRLDIKPIDTSGLSDEDAAEIEALLTAARKTQDYVIWGSGLWQAGPSLGLLGDRGHQDGRGVVLTVSPVKNQADAVSAKDVAQRVCECVNACRQLASPEATLKAVRELLRDIAHGLTDADDPRVAGLLAMLGPG